MPKLYRRPNSQNWYAVVYLWSEEKQLLSRERVSTGTDDEQSALQMATALEATAKTAQALAGKTISKSHAEALFLNMLSTAGISVEGDSPLPLLRSFLADFQSSREGKVSDASLKRYKTDHNKFLKWLNPIDPDKQARLDWLTRQRAGEYYAWLSGHLSVKSSRESFKWLTRAMKRAVEITDLEKNPCDSVELDRRGETLDRLPFTLPEATKLVAWLMKQGDREREWARCAALSLMSGCRIEDAIIMKQSAICEGVLTYTQKKTGKAITCPLVVPEWLSLITETGSGSVSPQLHKEFAQWGNADLSSEFTGYVSAAGIEQSHMTFKSGRKMARKTFHSLRHTLRTAIVSSGGSDAQADIILGHSDGEGKRYTHSEVDAMEATLTKAFTGTKR